MLKTQNVLKAIAEPRRLLILETLRDSGALSVTDVAGRVELTQQAASLHLKVLEEAGLVEARKEGTRHLYSVVPNGFKPVESFVSDFWSGHLDALKTTIEKK